MEDSRKALIGSFYKHIRLANKEFTKKELFKDLLHRLYDHVAEASRIIDAMSMGAETSVMNIPRKDRAHRGSADTLYNRVIIEFENDLKPKHALAHAKEQLAGYLLGRFNSGEGYNYTLIASDFIHWKVFTVDISCIEKLGNMREDELLLHEVPGVAFTLTEHNAEDFYYWIDRFLFKEEKQQATLKSIEDTFGFSSTLFVEVLRTFTEIYNDAKKYGEVQVSYEQWRKFLSIAYGSFDQSERNYLIHTYLSAFSKILAYTVVSRKAYLDDDDMKGLLSGDAFLKFNVLNFIDNDFFHWVKSNRIFGPLKRVFNVIAQEVAQFDFNDVQEDILKGVYQGLIDLDTRHSLGEYYTPDWLCDRVLQTYQFKPTDKILDPSCGSGSFLRATIHRIKTLHPHLTAEEINKCVYGIDIHPLSVQIAKTNVLLALGGRHNPHDKPLYLNVVLANTLDTKQKETPAPFKHCAAFASATLPMNGAGG